MSKSNSTHEKHESMGWDLFCILYGVTLSFSAYNAYHAKILIVGDIFYLVIGSKTFSEIGGWTSIMSTICYVILAVFNLILISFLWNVNRLKSMKLHWLLLKALFLGVTPMLFYYVTYCISKFILHIPSL